MYKIIAAAILMLAVSKVNSQVIVHASVGYLEVGKVNATVGGGYDYKHIIAVADMRASPYKDGAYIGAYSGYEFQWSIRVTPYVGYWYNLVGNTHKQDTYVHNGTVTVLSDNRAVNSSTFGGGLQFAYGICFIDVAYVGKAQANFGMRYKF